LGVPFISTTDSSVEDIDLRPRGSSFTARGPLGEVRIECPLAGEHQVENALTAVSILRGIGVPAELATEGLRRTRWPGRLEVVSESPEIILDGAHNPAGMRALAAYIRRFCQGRVVWVVCGAMRDKSLDEIAGILSSVADRIIVTAPDSQRALRQVAVERFFDHPAVEMAANTGQALSRAAEAPPGAAVFVTGSLLLVGEARKLLVR
jgi:dihydrofolate synthase/folylpolyglutamate synthase